MNRIRAVKLASNGPWLRVLAYTPAMAIERAPEKAPQWLLGGEREPNECLVVGWHTYTDFARVQLDPEPVGPLEPVG